MKQGFFIAILFFTLKIVIAQQVKVDSLQNVLKSASENKRSNIINELIEAFIPVSSDSAIFYADKLIFSDVPDEIKAKAYSSKGMSLMKLSKFDDAFINLNKAVALSKAYGNLEDIVNFTTLLGTVTYRSGDYSKALLITDTVLDISKQNNFVAIQGTIYTTRGNIYWYQGRFDKSIECYLNAVQIAEKLGNNRNISVGYNNIGIVNSILGNQEKALEYHQKSLKIKEKLGDIEGIIASFDNISAVYYNNKDYDKAISYTQKSLILNKKRKNKLGISRCFMDIGVSFYETSRYDSALYYTQQAIDLSEKYKLKQQLANSWKVLGKIYMATNKNHLATKYLKDALAEMKILGAQSEQVEIFLFLSELEEKGKNYEQALQYHKEYLNLKDTIFNAEKHQQITDVQTKYETEKKELEILRQKAQLERKDMELERKHAFLRTLIIAGIAILIIVVLGVNFYRQRQKHKRAVMERKNYEMENSLLRTQINPHFIFNSLNSINYFVINNQADDAQIFLTKFARLMRTILDHSASEFVNFDDEVDALKLYLELEQVRFGNNFDFEFIIDKKIDGEFTEIPPMLNQPYIENALIHGLSNLKDKQGKITVEYNLISEKDEELKCTITDNGIGRKAAENLNSNSERKHKSKGILISKKRLQILNENSNRNFTNIIDDLYSAENQPIGTKVSLTFPCKITD